MTTSEQHTGKQRSLENDPQFFGTYLNMARHNVFMLINHLTLKFEFGFNTFKNDKYINPESYYKLKGEKHFLSEVFDKSEEKVVAENKTKVFNYIHNHHLLPILGYFKSDIENNTSGKNPYQSLSDFLNLAFVELDGFRNSYTHYLAIGDNGKILDKKKELNKGIKEQLIGLFKEAPSFSYLRNLDTQTEDDYEHLNSYQLFEINSNTLTHQGFYFFICLFLERKYAIKFLKKFTGFKNETLPPFRATLKAFTAYCIKLPNDKIKNENPRQSLLMEMLNELNRCPKELFSHLNDEDKLKFDPKMDEKAKNNIILNSLNHADLENIDVESLIQGLSVMKRFDDRFPYFALRYLDEMNVFKNIRFQITLGNCTLRKYKKNILGKAQNRNLNKVINAFGKLSDFDNEEKVMTEIKNGNEMLLDASFEQFAPHYAICNNKIGLFIFSDDVTSRVKYPKILSDDKTNQPTAFLSIHDLPKLLLTVILSGEQNAECIIKNFVETSEQSILNINLIDEIKSKVDYSPDPEALTRKLIDQFKKFDKKKDKLEFEKRNEYKELLRRRRIVIQKVLNDYNLKADQLPTMILKYLMNIMDPNPQKRINYSVKKIKTETNNYLKKLERDEKNDREIHLGELATCITRDIINMTIDKELKNRITSPYYNKLQNKIAFFSINKDLIIKLCHELGLFDKDKGHVFLTKNMIMSSGGVISFFKTYFEAKARWIESLGKNKDYVISGTSINKVPYTFKKFGKESPILVDWLENKSKSSVELPNSLFNDSLNALLLRKIKEKGLEVKENVNGMSNYLGLLLEGDRQPFYDYQRRYVNKGKEHFFFADKLTSKQIKKYGDYEENNEKQIRFLQTKDRIMRLMSEKLIKADASLELNEHIIKLKCIYPKSDSSPLDSPVTFTKQLHDKKIIARDSDASKTEVLAWIKMTNKEKEDHPAKKSWYAWTIKDFGRFSKIFHDRRMLDMLKYFEGNEIPFSLLEYETLEYDKYREMIFDEIFKLEKTIADKDIDGVINLELNNGDRKFKEIQFSIYIQWLKERNLISDLSENLIKNIRNKFSHNQFPTIEVTKLNIISKEKMLDFEQRNQIKDYKGKDYISLSSKIFEIYKREIDSIITSINGLN